MSNKSKREKRAELFEQMKALDTDAKGDFNAEQQEQWDRLSAEIDKLGKEISDDERSLVNRANREQRMRDLESEMGSAVNERRDLGQPEERNRSENKENRAAFQKFLREGRNALNEREFRALQANSNVLGGYLIPPVEFVQEIIKDLDDVVYMRGLARVRTLSKAGSLGIPIRTNRASDAEWTSELSAPTKDSALRYGFRTFVTHPLKKEILVSEKLLNESPLGVEAEVRAEIQYVNGITQEKAFLTGTGDQQPLGIFVANVNGINTDRDVTATSATAWTADDLINVLYNLKGQYQARAAWFMHRDAVKLTRKLKDGNGQYIWTLGLQAGQPDNILNRPIYMSEFAPNTYTASQYAIVCGDFSQYAIVDSLQMEMKRLVELYAEQEQVAFITNMYCDGAPVKSEAFSRLIMHT